MNIAVRYQSRNGNTRGAAEIIAKELGIEAKPISEPLDGFTDILFVGGGVYMWDADKSLIEFLEKLSPQQVGQIAAFSTTGMMDSTVKRICECAKEGDIAVNSNTLCLKMYAHGHSALGMKGGNLTPKQKERIVDFTRSVVGDKL